MRDGWRDHEARRSTPPSPAGLARMAAALGDGAAVVDVRPLRGGIINATHRVEIRTAGGPTQRLVLKEFLATADDARREWHGLRIAQGSTVPVPAPIRRAEAGEWFENAAMLVTFLPGRPRIPTRPGRLPERLGRALAGLHRSDVSGRRAERFRPPRPNEAAGLLAEASAAVESRLAGLDLGPPVLLHRDFWVGNVLWRLGRVSGIVDWSKSGIGPRGYDVGFARVDAALVWGRGAADRLAAAYSRVAGPVSDLPVWDLVCGADALENAVWWARGYQAHGRHDLAPARVEARLSAFLRRALDRL